jgi:hypothetical protein
MQRSHHPVSSTEDANNFFNNYLNLLNRTPITNAFNPSFIHPSAVFSNQSNPTRSGSGSVAGSIPIISSDAINNQHPSNSEHNTDVYAQVRRQQHILSDTITDYNMVSHQYIQYLNNNRVTNMNNNRFNSIMSNIEYYNQNVSRFLEILKLSQENVNVILYVSEMTKFLQNISNMNNRNIASTAAAAATTPNTSQSATPVTTTSPDNTVPEQNPSTTRRPRGYGYRRYYTFNQENTPDSSPRFNIVRLNQCIEYINHQEIHRENLRENIIDISNNVHNIESDEYHDRCPISLENFQENEIICRIRGCGHRFKIQPLMNWFSIHTDCPVCRYDILTYESSVSNSTSTNIQSNENIEINENDDENENRQTSNQSQNRREQSNAQNQTTNTDRTTQSNMTRNMEETLQTILNDMMESLNQTSVQTPVSNTTTDDPDDSVPVTYYTEISYIPLL